MLQVGACIVNKEKKIVGIGYNGMPNGCSDDVLPWQRTSDNWLETKYPYGWLVTLFCTFSALTQRSVMFHPTTLCNVP